MVFVIDLIVIGIVLLFTIISAKQGFVRTVVGAIGFVAAVLIAFTASKPLADATYDKFIEPPILNSVVESANGTLTETTDGVWESIPSFITDNAQEFGFTKESIENALKGGTQDDIRETFLNVSQTAIKPICTQVISTVFAVILMLVLLVIVRFLAKLLNKAFSFSVVGKVNATLGGVLGFIKGVLIALIVCEVIVLIISFTDNGIWIFNNENIDKTIIFKSLTNIF